MKHGRNGFRCDMSGRIDFSVDEFFPPERCEFLEDGQDDPSVGDSSDQGCGYN